MLEYFKTPTGSYWLTIIITGFIWLLTGGGFLAGINHYYAKSRDSEIKAKSAMAESKELRSNIARTKDELSITKDDLIRVRSEAQALREQIAPRKLNDYQIIAFTHAVSDKPKGQFRMSSRFLDTESREFAVIVGMLLYNSGFELAVDATMDSIGDEKLVGLTVEYAVDAPPPHANTLIEGFRAAGIPAKLEFKERYYGEGIINIVVGSKPNHR